MESLERFVRREPLRRVHECVFGVLALESEPVDPRLYVYYTTRQRGATLKGAMEDRRKEFPSRPVQGFFVDCRLPVDAPTPFQHYFCGAHDIDGAWCPHCKKLLLRFLALDTQDARLDLLAFPSSRLSLLFCWTCNIAQEPFFYRALDHSIELLRCGGGGVEMDFPYTNYPTFFAGGRALLYEISAEEQAFLKRINKRFEDETEEERVSLRGQHQELWGVRHQVGGEPFLAQVMIVLECPDCGADMPFLASVANDCLDTRGFAGDDGVQVLYHLCRKCRVVGAYQQCD